MTIADEDPAIADPSAAISDEEAAASSAATSRAISAALSTRWLGRALKHLARCRSTNDEAAAWARQGAPHGAVVVADAQSRGRGRLGRAWHSPVGENLYFSAVLRPPIAPADAPPLTLCAGVALHDAVCESGAGRIAPELKWPNDLLVDGKKLAGILTEMSAAGSRVEQVVVGIGVNLRTRVFPDELRDRATSLALALEASAAKSTDEQIEQINYAAFVAALCAHLELWYERYIEEGPRPIVAAWRARSRVFGKTVTVSLGKSQETGVAEDLDEDGALRLRTGDGRIIRVVAGELV